MKNKLLLALVLIVYAKVNFAQAPNLGTASSFALFTSAGAFTNVGITNITGDIGTDVGILSGSPTVIGSIHVADPVSAQAAIDLNVAYNYLNTVTCDSVIGISLGNGQILTPKVYCIGAASTLNANLILDGQGDLNALFIFKINGALSTSISSNIILVNAASLCNVYWQINGAFVLGDSSVFRGTILGDGAINLLESSSLFGRGLTTGGAITLQNNFVDISIPPLILLPIELLSFTALSVNGNVQLAWSTATETNNDHFTIERSANGIYFEEVLQIPGAGNSLVTHYYSASDHEPYEETSYYRLKQTDFNGRSTYSNLIAIDRETIFDLKIYPNPFYTSISFIMDDGVMINNALLNIYNADGKEVKRMNIICQKNILETSDLPSGIYYYKLINNNLIVRSGKLISLH